MVSTPWFLSFLFFSLQTYDQYFSYINTLILWIHHQSHHLASHTALQTMRDERWGMSVHKKNSYQVHMVLKISPIHIYPLPPYSPSLSCYLIAWHQYVKLVYSTWKETRHSPSNAGTKCCRTYIASGSGMHYCYNTIGDHHSPSNVMGILTTLVHVGLCYIKLWPLHANWCMNYSPLDIKNYEKKNFGVFWLTAIHKKMGIQSSWTF